MSVIQKREVVQLWAAEKLPDGDIAYAVSGGLPGIWYYAVTLGWHAPGNRSELLGQTVFGCVMRSTVRFGMLVEEPVAVLAGEPSDEAYLREVAVNLATAQVKEWHDEATHLLTLTEERDARMRKENKHHAN